MLLKKSSALSWQSVETVVNLTYNLNAHFNVYLISNYFNDNKRYIP